MSPLSRRLLWGAAVGLTLVAVVWWSPLREVLYAVTPALRIDPTPLVQFYPVPRGGDDSDLYVVDLNGDGQRDLAAYNGIGTMTYSLASEESHILWVNNYDTDFGVPSSLRGTGETFKNYRYTVTADYDLDQDGWTDVLSTVSSRTGDRWRLKVLSGDDGHDLATYDLPVGLDLRSDGLWDGQYEVIGVLPEGVAAPEAGPTAVIIRQVGYDRLDRGVVCLDLVSGAHVWEYLMASNPDAKASHLADLDLDGRPEIVVLGNGPANLRAPEECVDGFCDDRVRMFALTATGQKLWQVPLTEDWGSRGYSLVTDLDGDGQPEIVAATGTRTAEDPNALWAIDARGQVLGKHELATPAYSVVCTGQSSAERRVVVGTRDGRVQSFTWDKDDWRLADSGEIDPRGVISSVARFGPDREYLISFTASQIRVLTPDLTTVLTEDFDRKVGRATILQVSDDRPLLACLTDTWRVRALRPQKTYLLALAALGLAPLPVAAAWRRRRPLPPEDQSESLRELARRFKRDNHSLLLFRGLDAFLMRLRVLDPKTSDEETLQQRLAEPLDRCRRLVEHDLPDCRTALDLTETLGIGDGDRRRLTSLLDELERLLKTALVHDDPLAYFQSHNLHIQTVRKELAKGMEQLYGAFASQYGNDLRTVIGDVVQDRAGTFTDTDVDLVLGTGGAESTRVIVPRSDLIHLFDNLVGNACRAMHDSTTRRLQIDVKVEGQRVVCEFVDTGPGVAPELQDVLFHEPVASESGTGEGLYDAAQTMARYDGQLECLDPGPEGGARIRLILPRL